MENCGPCESTMIEMRQAITFELGFTEIVSTSARSRGRSQWVWI